MKKILSGCVAGLLATFSLILLSYNSQASHIFGMDLSYQWLHDSTYQITLTAYGDCSPAGASAFATLPTATPKICIYNGATNVTSINLAVQSPSTGVEVTPVCNSDTAATQCHSTSSTILGIKRFIYTGTYTLPAKSHYWRFLFGGNMGASSGTGRTASITNITGGTILALEDTLDNTSSQNTSPTLPVIPTPYYYLNHSDSYNPGASDPDGDSLNFVLVAGATGTGATACASTFGTVTYSTGLSGAAPLQVSTPLSLNTHSGQIDFIPNATQRADIVYNIEEYRGGTKIGTSQREMTFLVVTDPTSPASGTINTLTNGTLIDSADMSTCVNTGAFSFDISPRAYDTTWNVVVTTSGVPSWASLAITNNGTTHPTVAVTGNNTGVTPGTYVFYLTYTDNGCPIGQSVTAPYTITILAPPSISAISGPDSVCLGGSATYTDTATLGGWSLSNTAIATISAAGLLTPIIVGVATYDSVKYTETNNCGSASVSKVVLIKPGTSAGVINGSSNICTGTTTSFTDTVTGGTWSSVTTSIATINSSTGLATGVSPGSDTIKYTVTGFCGAVSATKVVTVTSTPTAGTITGPTHGCVGTGIVLSNTTTGGVWSHTNTAIASLAGSTLIGTSAGVDTVKYTVTASCGNAVATHIDTIYANPDAGTISGASIVCQSATTTLTTTGSGGTWSSDSTTIATVSAAGVVTGVRGGVDTIRYTVTGTCGTQVARFAITITPMPAPAAISGAPSLCPGDTSTFTDPTTGGRWSSSNTAAATVDSMTGLVTGVALGTTNISYTVTGTCGAVAVGEALAVNGSASAGTITGATYVCPGTTTPLGDVVTGGIWSSSTSSVATVNSSGVVTGVTPGIDTIKYSVIQTCGSAFTKYVITVPLSNPTISPITGTDSVCAGSSVTLTDTTSGGTWSSLLPTIATVNATGLVTGVLAGMDTIKYTVNNSCGSSVAKVAFKVNPLPVHGAIGGSPSACPGSTTTLTETVAGGTWSSANAARATVTSGGVVHGITVGRVVISYSITNSCGTVVDTVTVTVNPLATVSHITGTLSACQTLTSALADSTAGGVWSSSSTDVAVISSTGVVTAVLPGTTTIYYAVTNVCSTATDSVTFTSLPQPDAGNITGTPTVCPGTTAVVADVITGGTWSTSNNSIATVNSTGLVTGVTAGIDSIYYTVTNSCGTAHNYILAVVNPVPVAGVVSGTDSVCQGSTTTFTTTGTTGGTWTSANSGIATVGLAGNVGGVATGSTNITYTLTNSCGTASSSKSIFVKPLPTTGSIAGATSVCPAGTTGLSDGVSGGSWSSTNTSVATINGSGTVTGVNPGSTIISYTLTNSCGVSAATLAFTVTAPPTAGVITGSPTVCNGGSITLSDTVTGGTWSASNGNATINSTTGLLGGITNGADTITYHVIGTCGSASTTFVVTVGAPASAGAITGPSNVCIGSTIALNNTIATGGTWSSHNTLIATVGGTTGICGGVSSGTTTITYTLTSSCGASIATYSVTVSPAPSAGVINGLGTVCVGSNITLTDTTSGGSWSISNANATIAAGVVTGVAAGLDTVTYSVTNACTTAKATEVVTINPLPDPGAISGVTTICQGNTSTLSESATGGSWSSSNTAIATVNGSTGAVTGLLGGNVNITYTVSNSCGSATNVFPITIIALPVAGAISGPSSVCIGSSITLVDTNSGGTWTSSSPSVATVTSAGLVTGLVAGTTNIDYTVSNSCGNSVASSTINVSIAPNAGTLSGSTIFCVGASSLLSSTSTGGVWSSTNTSIATVNSSTGNVTGVAAGTSLISYVVTTGCGSAFDTTTVTVNAVATGGTIAGSNNVCVGSSINLTDGVAGGAWTSGSPSVATITSGGVVTGLTSGTSVITYTVTSSCGTGTAFSTITVSPAPAAGSITGSGTVCVGSTTSLSDAAGGGTWSSSNTAAATIDASGAVTGLSTGSTIISYTVATACSTAVATLPMTVNPLPNAGTITGALGVCTGATTNLSDVVTGGTWISGNTSVATINSTGQVTGVSVGTSVISYIVSNSCGNDTARLTETVSPSPVPGTITGATSLCAGSTTTLGETSSGGTWSSTNTSAATIDASGLLTAIAAGTTTISYTVATACATAAATITFTVNPLPAAGTISGPSVVCTGATVNLLDGATGGTWTSGTPGVATVSTSGVVTGVSNGTSIISYTVSNSCGAASATQTVTVNTIASAGTITGPASICTGTATSYASTASGGSWSSSNPSVASVNASGVVSAYNAGSITLSYSVASSCGSAVSTAAVSVILTPTSGTVSGASSLCVGTSSTFTTTMSGGTWSSSNSAVASVNASGLVTAVATGTAVISYNVTNTCGTGSGTASVTIVPIAAGGTISGTTSFCAGTTSALTETSTGGTWSSSNTAVATVNASGVVTGVSGGTSTISYSVSGSCGSAFATTTVTISPAADSGTISGAAAVCVGSSVHLTETSTTGSWGSSNTSVATVDASGNVTGVAVGTATISYTASNACGTVSAIHNITVALPAVTGTISGATTLCQGATTTFTETSSTGTWSSGNSSVATVSSAGVVTGTGGGIDTIYYTVATACSTAVASSVINVSPLPVAGTIAGTSVICTGSSVTLVDTAAGGSWSSSNPSVASVATTGVVTGVSAGSATISYVVIHSCGTASATFAVSVSNTPNAGTITGSPNVCIGSTATLTDAATGGTWSSSNPSAVSVSSSGIITGVSNGTAIISYTVAAACSTAVATINAAANPFPNAGTISGPTNICLGTPTNYVDTTAGGVWSTGSSSVATVSTAGVVTGVGVGSTNIYYSVSNACGATNVTISIHVLSTIAVGAITGTTTICPGSSAALSDTTHGGAWSSSDSAIVSVTAAGVITGVASGSATITYSVASSCGAVIATTAVTVRPATDPGVISGTTTFCVGATSALSETVSGGTWSSINAAIATVSASGVVTGVSGGIDTILYSVSGICGTTVAMYTINVTPLTTAGTITGPSSVCLGLSAGLGDTVSGGTWTSSTTSVATVSTTGLVTGVAIGSTTISYTVSGTCRTAVATYAVTVTSTPSEGFITGSTGVCAGTTTSLSESVTGGTWSSGTPSIATVNTSGVVTGVSGGNVIISYTVSNACGLAVATAYLTVRPLPAVGIITGSTSICMGTTATLVDTAGASAGTWSSSNTAVATVSTSGVVTPVATGSTTISYSLSNSCGTASAIATVTVNDIPATAGVVTGGSALCPASTVTLVDTVSGGSWSSSNTSVATISTSGNVTAVAAGTTTISYTISNSCGSRSTSTVITVNPGAAVGAIVAATTSVCTGATITLTDTSAGGTWSTGDTTIATVSASGVVTGWSAGSVRISYSVTSTCGTAATSVLVNVNATPSLAAISGPSTLCAGSTGTLTESVSGGNWSVSSSSIATVNSFGVITGVAAGIVTTTYTLTSGAGCTAVEYHMDTVIAAPSAGSITASTTAVCAGASITLSSTVSGGTWSSSDTTLATVDASGHVHGLAFGAPTITYSVSSSCGTVYTTVTVNVYPSPVVSPVSGATSMCTGSSVTLSESTTGGTWSSSDTLVASVTSGGAVTGIAPGTALVAYSVTNGFGCTTSATIMDTVNNVPTVAAIAGATHACAGTLHSLSDATTGGTWSSSDATVATINASGAFRGNMAGVVTFSYVVGASGCSATATYNDTIIAAPVVGAITGTTSVCVGSSTTLSDTTTGGTWTSYSTSVAAIGSTGIVSGLAAGTDSIGYTVTNSAGCSSTSWAVVSVNAIPSVAAITGTGNACLGGVAILTDTTTGGVWSSNAPSIASVNSATGAVTGVSLGTTTITYTVTSAGCAAFVTITETVQPLPVVSAISGSSTVCLGSMITLNDTTSGGSWSSSNNSIATIGSTGVVTGVAAGVDTLVYTFTNSFGCSSMATTVVTVNVGGSIHAIAGSSTICLGSSATLSDSTTGGSWSSSDTTLAVISTGGVITGVRAGAVTIYYRVSSTSGCPGVAVFHDTVHTVSGTLMPTSHSLTICHGNPVTMSVVSGTATSFQWYRNSAIVLGAAGNSYTTDSTGMYSVDLSDGTCSASIGTITVTNSVVPVIHHTTGTTTLYTGSYATYQWFRNGGAIAGATNSTYNYNLTGSYVVVVTEGGGCTDTSAVYVVTKVSVNNVAANNMEISLYPNPATSTVTIDAPVSVNVTILSADGKVVITQSDAKSVDVSNLSGGLYLIMIYDQNNALLKTDKFIKVD